MALRAHAGVGHEDAELRQPQGKLQRQSRRAVASRAADSAARRPTRPGGSGPRTASRSDASTASPRSSVWLEKRRPVAPCGSARQSSGAPEADTSGVDCATVQPELLVDLRARRRRARATRAPRRARRASLVTTGGSSTASSMLAPGANAPADCSRQLRPSSLTLRLAPSPAPCGARGPGGRAHAQPLHAGVELARELRASAPPPAAPRRIRASARPDTAGPRSTTSLALEREAAAEGPGVSLEAARALRQRAPEQRLAPAPFGFGHVDHARRGVAQACAIR